jgi:DNA recombination protein RmuC
LLARRQGERALRRGELELAAMRAQTAAIERRLHELRQAEEKAGQATASLAELRAQTGGLERRLHELRAAEDRAGQAEAALAELRAHTAALDRRLSELRQVEERAGQATAALAELRAHTAGLERRLSELRQAEEEAGRAECALAELRTHTAGLERRLNELEQVDERAGQLAEALAAERAMASERLAAAEHGRLSMRHEFDVLGRSMLEQNHQSLTAVLAPMHERLREFEDKVKLSYDADNRDRGALLEKLRGLQEAQTRLHADAQALTRALTGDSRSQGDWGELVLESLLSTAGLTEGREYELQVDQRDEEGGHRRPDAIIYLPPDRALVIDSKCSLTAFVESTRTPHEAEREAALEAHGLSLRAHVKTLSGKDYHRLLRQRTLDLVLLFVPSEAAFHAAVSRDPQLYEDAFRQRVVLTSPTTLLATLQVVNHVWRSERQTQNARRIAQEAGKMIEKLALGLEAFSEVGDRLDKAHHAFEEARKRLVTGRGNALALARKVAQLGARSPHPERVVAVAQQLDAELADDELIAALEAETGGDDAEQLELVPAGGVTHD